MKKIIGIVCGIVVGCVTGLSFAASDRWEGDTLYDCHGFVSLKKSDGTFEKEKIMHAHVKDNEPGSEAPRKFRELFEENGNRVNDPIECYAHTHK